VLYNQQKGAVAIMLERIKQLKKDRSGFTIIEVMIVLAIAGLIMVIVLVAIPQLQRNQRNTATKEVVNRVLTELESYAGNNGGAYPATAATFGNTAAGTCPAAGGTTFTSRYLSNVTVNDPRTGSCVGFTLVAAVTAPPAPAGGAARVIQFHAQAPGAATTGYRCNGETVIAGTGARNIAVSTWLEGGAVYCADNT
jgi:prepilin-type N-terminal cleavage/methylation domain-containing protein